MRSLLRTFALPAVLACLGLIYLWWLTPQRPRYGWQPQRGECFVAFLDNGREIITRDDREPGHCTIRIWDVESGEQTTCYAIPTLDPEAFINLSRDESCLQVLHYMPTGCIAGFLKTEVRAVRTGVPLWSREGERSQSGSMYLTKVNWSIGANAALMAYALNEDGEADAYVADLPSGRVLYSINKAVDALFFSRDGTKLLASSNWGLWLLLDAKSGVELARKEPETHSWVHCGPAEFALDERTIVDGSGKVWDASTARQLGCLPAIGRTPGKPCFSPDCQYLLTVEKGENALGGLLKSYDLQTGEERIERRVLLSGGAPESLSMNTLDGRLAIVSGTHEARGILSSLEPAISNIPALRRLVPPASTNRVTWVIDADSCRLLSETQLDVLACSAVGRWLAANAGNSGFLLYDLPPRKSLLWFEVGAGIWLLVPGSWGWWRWRGRLRNAKTLT